MKAHKVLPERAPLDMPRHRVNERGHTLRQHSPSFFHPSVPFYHAYLFY